MKKLFITSVVMLVLLGTSGQLIAQEFLYENQDQRDARMAWWREARFGLFIHWGLYSIPAGVWKGDTNHAEWIRTTAEIPLKEYDKFVDQFNPTKFDAESWVRTAKEAGMKYIVITSKHHDGFCLFDSKYTDFDIMSTPFKRDVLKELADACHKEGIKICWYYSIMDWHHPDYLPRRSWEKDRPTDGADFDRYVEYMKNQLKELLTNYGNIGVLWFDGEWEDTWNANRGRDLYEYVRRLEPNIIINNRVGAGRSGMEGMTKLGEFAGDFGTPEQEIPATGMPGVDWESCMTMNDHWGYNSHDNNWKSPKELIRDLADIASKGGNLLLNIGPTAEGVFPAPSIERLHAIGAWMKVNGESIYGTSASPFRSLAWGRCTQKPISHGTRLYLHVFDWPENGNLVVPGLQNVTKTAFLLSDSNQKRLRIGKKDDDLVVRVPHEAPDSLNSVVVLDVVGKPDINYPPDIIADRDYLVDPLEITVSSDRPNVDVRYTLDGSAPTDSSAIARGRVRLVETTQVTAQCFRGDKPVSAISKKTFRKVKPIAGVANLAADSGLQYSYYEGSWDTIPDFQKLTPLKEGTIAGFVLPAAKGRKNFGVEYDGYIRIPKDGVYTFSTESDDGSRLYVGSQLVVDNDSLHGMVERKGYIPLAAGFHPFKVKFFQKLGESGLNVYWQGPGITRANVPDSLLWRRR